MFTYPFSYRRASSISEAEALFADNEEAMFLSGGQTLLPTMKNRLAAPLMLIDLHGIPQMNGMARNRTTLDVGAATTHYALSVDRAVRATIPSLALIAGSIADPQVRNLGTLGGSVASNDPAADYPAAVLSLKARIVTNRREIRADDYFLGLFTTALEPGEFIVRVVFPVPQSAGYAKMCSKASRYAMAASFVTLNKKQVRVAITGSGANGVFRWADAEAALKRDFSLQAIGGLQVDPARMSSDMHGDAIYRASLAAEMTRRAIANMQGAWIG